MYNTELYTDSNKGHTGVGGGWGSDDFRGCYVIGDK